MNENQPDVLITRALTARAGRREPPNRGAYVIVFLPTGPGATAFTRTPLAAPAEFCMLSET
jgi:hypothetical protein